MQMNSWALYKVIEIERGLAIISAFDKSDRLDAIELVLAELPICMEYLVRYVHERAVAGQERELAHITALRGLNVIRAWMQVPG